jgi:8-oxo-dGTP pyrophosphatase MutT (NUDIX family)
VRPGETVLDMLREAEEEIGLTVAPGRADYLVTLRSERRYPDGAVDREFQDVYVTLVEGRELTDYALDCAEVTVLYEAPLERLVAFYRDGGSLPVAGWDCQQRHNHALLISDDVIEEGRALTLESLEHVQRWWASHEPT